MRFETGDMWLFPVFAYYFEGAADGVVGANELTLTAPVALDRCHVCHLTVFDEQTMLLAHGNAETAAPAFPDIDKRFFFHAKV